MRVEIPFVVLNKKGRPVEGADVTVFKRADYDAGGNVYGLSSASASGTNYTYITDYPHGLITGNLVTVTGSSVAAYNVTSAAITDVPTTSSFVVVGGTNNPDIPVISGGKVVRVPLAPAYLYSNPDDNTTIPSLTTDGYGRINAWLDEGQYVIRISGLNVDATQYFEAVAANIDSGTFTRAGVTLGNDSIKFGQDLIISSTPGGDVKFPGNSGTNNYSTVFTASAYTAGTGTRTLFSTTSLDSLPPVGDVTVQPDQTLGIDSATKALNGTVSPPTYDFTYTTSTTHTLTVGSRVVISGASNGSYNGEFTISSVAVDNSTFTVGGPTIDPGTTGFSSGEAECYDQSYKISYDSVDVVAKSISFSAATGVHSISNYDGSLALCDLPSFTDSSSATVVSGFGSKNSPLAVPMTAVDADVEALRTTLNSLIQDLKKYGIIS